MKRSFCPLVALLLLGVAPLRAAAQVPVQVPAPERLCDTRFEDCREPILNLIRNEQIGIDVGFWYMQDSRYATELVNKWNAGVPVRVLVDTRANPTYPANPTILAQLASAGIPMREKFGEDVLHFKMMLFHGQNMVEFSKANYDPFAYVAATPNSNYEDEAVFFTNDDRITNSFRRRFDDRWIDTVVFRNYANITAPLARTYPLYPIAPEMDFPPLEDFGARMVSRMNAENVAIDAIVFRATDTRQTDAVSNAIARGVPVRIITEPQEYRNPKRLYDAKEIDRMYMKGAQIKIRQHQGLTHEASMILHGLGEVIFGSGNWTIASAVNQDEHNYFYNPSLGKQWFFDWFKQQFDVKWNDPSLFVPFQPLPPGSPAYSSPANASTGTANTVTLTWDGGPWSHFYDIYFGATPDPPLVASNLQLGSPDPGVMETYTVNGLLPGTTYYWRIVDRTWAQQTNSGPVWSFTTGGVSTTPAFGGTPWTVPGQIEAENFDNGGQGVAYFDTTPTINSGGVYRLNEGVDIETTSDTGGGYDVMKTKPGEWLQYSVNVTASGSYPLDVRIANIGTGGQFHIEVDGVDKTGPVAVPNTGAWQTWQTVTTPAIPMTIGPHVVRLSFDTLATGGGVGNYNWIKFVGTAPSPPPPPPPPPGNTPHGGTPWPMPGTVQAEDFDDGGQSVAYSDTTAINSGNVYRTTEGVDLEATTDIGGGFDVMKTKPSEWMKYTINVTVAGTYTLDVRIANMGTGGAFHVEVDGVNKTGSIAVPDTGGWQTWQTLSIPGVTLAAGQHVMKVSFDTAGTSGGVGNYNWFRIGAGSPPPPAASTPFTGTPAPVPGTVQAENFDNGGQSLAYFDTTSANSGGIYRPNEGVDLEASGDIGGGVDVMKTRAGEWMKYTVSATAGTYPLAVRVANVGTGAQFHVEVDGVNQTGSVTLPDTGGWQTWQTLPVGNVSLPGGTHVIRFVFDAAGTGGGVGNFNWFQIG